MRLQMFACVTAEDPPMDDQTTSFEADFIHLYLHQVNSTDMNGFKDKDSRAESGSARRFFILRPVLHEPKIVREESS